MFFARGTDNSRGFWTIKSILLASNAPVSLSCACLLRTKKPSPHTQKEEVRCWEVQGREAEGGAQAQGGHGAAEGAAARAGGGPGAEVQAPRRGTKSSAIKLMPAEMQKQNIIANKLRLADATKIATSIYILFQQDI